MPSAAALTTTITPDVDNGTLLRRRAGRRRARGAWFAVLVILLAGLAGGAGWWFGSGPGSLVAVPDVAGTTFDEAAARLQQETLVAVQGEGEYSLEVDSGLVLNTDPGPGERVDKDATVSVVLSLGPQPHDLSALAGQPEDVVRTTLSSVNIEVGESVNEFTDAASGTVLAALAQPVTGDPFDVSNGGTVLEGSTITLTVSLGPVPPVEGLSVEAATSALQGANLQVSGTREEEFSDDIDSGDVIAIRGQPDGRNWRPGDTATLVVSKGPQPYPIPDVRDLTRDEARETLEDAGFTVDFAPFWNAFPNALTRVTGTDPATGAERPLGTSVYLQITASG